MDALIIVDFQNDFVPGGALPVAEGNRIAGPINRLLDSERFDYVVATRDWHPPDHGSFEDSGIDESAWRGIDPPGIWPVHCVQGSHGAEFYAELKKEQIDAIVDAGYERDYDGYSGFEHTDLAERLKEHAVDHVFVTGLATDYCVKHTALDGRREGFEVTVVEDAIRGVEVKPGDSERAKDEMRAAGADFTTSEELLAKSRA